MRIFISSYECRNNDNDHQPTMKLSKASADLVLPCTTLVCWRTRGHNSSHKKTTTCDADSILSDDQLLEGIQKTKGLVGLSFLLAKIRNSVFGFVHSNYSWLRF